MIYFVSLLPEFPGRRKLMTIVVAGDITCAIERSMLNGRSRYKLQLLHRSKAQPVALGGSRSGRAQAQWRLKQLRRVDRVDVAAVVASGARSIPETAAPGRSGGCKSVPGLGPFPPFPRPPLPLPAAMLRALLTMCGRVHEGLAHAPLSQNSLQYPTGAAAGRLPACLPWAWVA